MTYEKDYWDRKVALICSYCVHYVSFSTVEELKAHIEAYHNLCPCCPWDGKTIFNNLCPSCPLGRQDNIQ